MVDISKETAEQTHDRLSRVIRESRLTVFHRAYVFEEFSLTDFERRVDPMALAIVRDDEVWSQLVEVSEMTPNHEFVEAFCLWRFHFPACADNSGFVGWLASHLKNRFGTGIFVICGHNCRNGGIFDYWGGPLELRDELIGEVRRLTGQDQ